MEPMFPAAISNSTCMTDDEVITASSVSRVDDFRSLNSIVIQSAVSSSSQQQPQIKIKKKRNLPGNPDPDAEVIALSPKTLLATNRFICEICNKGFQRDQNLQLHRRGHNLPWKLKQRNNNSTKEIKKRAYVCPEPSCVHHHPSRALGDLTGIKKHFSRKHGEKKWMCEKCSKIYAVQSDWKAHTKTCGTREYKCHCGTLFSRKDSFITHRAFCDALAEESARLSANSIFTTENTTFGTAIRPPPPPPPPLSPPPFFSFTTQQHQQLENPSLNPMYHNNPSWNASSHIRNPKPSITHEIKPEAIHFPISTPFNYPEHPQKSYVGPSSFQVQNLLQSSVPQLSATALLQRASSLGAHSVGHVSSTLSPLDMRNISIPPPPVFGTWQENSDRLTRDFLGLTGEQFIGTGVGMGNGGNVDVNVNVNMRGVLSFTGRVEFPAYNERADLSALAPNHHQNFGYLDPNAPGPGTWRNC